MVDHQILLPDGGESIAAVIADAFRIARIVGHEFEIGPVELRELRQIVERQHAVDHEHFVVGDRERALHEAAQLGRHGGVEFEPDHRTAAALLQRGLEQPHQVFGFFLDFQFGIADDAEGALPLDGVAGKQPADEQRGRLFQRDQADALVGAARQPDEALDLLRHADERVHRLAVLHARQLQRDREAEIGNERKRMRRIDRERRQQRKHVREEMLFEPGALRSSSDRAPSTRVTPAAASVRPQFDPALLLIVGELR